MDANASRVIFLGTGALPSPRRAGASQLLVTRSERILIDCGRGSLEHLLASGVVPSQLTCLILTHLHAGHWNDLLLVVDAVFSTGRDFPLQIYGPPGTRSQVNALIAEKLQHTASSIAKPPRWPLEVTDTCPGVFSLVSTITSVWVNHGDALALGFRIDTTDGSVAFSGDSAPSKGFISLARDVDLLVHECTFPDSAEPNTMHTSPSQLGSIAEEAGARHLAMTHFHPDCDNVREEMILAISRHYKGDIIFCEDMMNVCIR